MGKENVAYPFTLFGSEKDTKYLNMRQYGWATKKA